MAAWWNGMILFEQIMFVIACVASVILIIQLILLFVGLGSADADIDADVDGDVDVDHSQLFNLKLFSIRGIMGFLAIGGWVGLLMSQLGLAVWLAALIAFFAGAVTAVIIALVYKLFDKLESDGNIDIKKSVGSSGTVYIPVPGKGQGRGKVNVTMEDRIVEYDAITEEEQAIPTNFTVKVVGIMDETTIVVRPV